MIFILQIYPFKSRKKHPIDYVRKFPHLRAKTKQFSALLRLRSAAQQKFNESLQVFIYE